MINLEKFDKELDKLFEGIENIEEHHIETRDARVSFILNNSESYSELDLVKMSDDEIKDIYFPLCDEIFGDGENEESFEDNEISTETQDDVISADTTIPTDVNTVVAQGDEEIENTLKEENNVSEYESYQDNDGDTIYKVDIKAGKNFLSNVKNIVASNEKLENLLNNLSNGDGIETEDGYIFWANDIFDFLKEGKNLQEEKQPDAITQLNRIKDINKENALGYFKNLNKGIQKMVNGEEGSEIEYDFDKNDGEVVNPNNKYNYAKEKNDEYLEKAHRGLEDIKLDEPNKVFDDRMKVSMDIDKNPLGKKMYDNKEKRNKFIDDNELKNTPMPGRMTISNKVPMKESLSGFYYDKLKNRKVVTFILENVDLITEVTENLRKVETQGMGNKSLNENIDNEIVSNDFYVDVENNKFYKTAKEKKKIKISESYLKRMNTLTNYNTNDAVNTSKNINRKLI